MDKIKVKFKLSAANLLDLKYTEYLFQLYLRYNIRISYHDRYLVIYI